jgi:hypothetical protein
MGMEIIRQDSMLSQVVIAYPMVDSTILGTGLFSGVRPRTTTPPLGPASCITTIAFSGGALALATMAVSRPETLFVPLGIIDYFSILWVGLEGGEIFFENCLAIVLPIFSITSNIIRLVVKKYIQSIIFI